jgi:hypothetical protein
VNIDHGVSRAVSDNRGLYATRSLSICDAPIDRGGSGLGTDGHSGHLSIGRVRKLRARGNAVYLQSLGASGQLRDLFDGKVSAANASGCAGVVKFTAGF